MTSGASTPVLGTSNPSGASTPASRAQDSSIPRRLTPNPNSTLPAPKVMTKAALQAEATMRDKLRKDFLVLQEGVRNTEVQIPFVFYDGTNIPGGVVKVKKGDNIWLFLDRCRKVGAELGIGGGASGKGASQKNKNDSRREWARISVDDLLLVREEVIIPHVSSFPQFGLMVEVLTKHSIMNSTTSLPTKSARPSQVIYCLISPMSCPKRKRTEQSRFCAFPDRRIWRNTRGETLNLQSLRWLIEGGTKSISTSSQLPCGRPTRRVMGSRRVWLKHDETLRAIPFSFSDIPDLRMHLG